MYFIFLSDGGTSKRQAAQGSVLSNSLWTGLVRHCDCVNVHTTRCDTTKKL